MELTLLQRIPEKVLQNILQVEFHVVTVVTAKQASDLRAASNKAL